MSSLTSNKTPESQENRSSRTQISLDLNQPITKLIFQLAWPVLLQQVLVLCVGLFDRFLAGNYPPADESLHVAYQAAQTTANYLGWFLANASAVVTVGSTALVARLVGAKDRFEANRVCNQSIILAIALGLLGTVLGLSIIGEAVRWMQLRDNSAQIAVEFLLPILLLLPLQMVESAGIACLIGAGDTRIGLMVLGGVAVINMPLAWIFFQGIGTWSGLGFIGIGLGTAVSHAIGGISVLIVLSRGRAQLKLQWQLLAPNAHLIRRILRISIPAAIDVLSICLCQMWFLALVNRLGVIPSAAHGIAIQWEALGYLSGQAFAVAAMTLVGQNLGAGRPDRAVRCGWFAMQFGALTMSLMGVIFYTFAEPMFQLFCPSDNQLGVIQTGVPVLQMVAFSMPTLASILILTGALRGAGDTRVPVLLTWIGFLGIRMPLSVFLMYDQIDLGFIGSISGMGLGLIGAWLAMFADLTIRGALFQLRFYSEKWKKIKV